MVGQDWVKGFGDRVGDSPFCHDTMHCLVVICSVTCNNTSHNKSKGNGGIKMNVKNEGFDASLVETIDLTGEFMRTEGGSWAQG